MTKDQVHVFYTGQVQGVGFRYRTQYIAGAYAVSGWVRNLPDGRVELLAQADKQDLQRFLAQIEEELDIYIRGKQVLWDKADKQYQGFNIAF